MPCEKDTGICVKQSCRMCCCFLQRNVKLVSVGGDEGFISCFTQYCGCAETCQIPPKNMFCEILSIRLTGPKEKNKSVFPAGEGDMPQKVVETSAANFGRAYTDSRSEELPLALMMNKNFEVIADKIWDMVPSSVTVSGPSDEIPMTLKM